ncbi:MAG: sensor histidine kinase [Chitinophagaceae bacterium]|nr:MAG: sensor histidine kinase [Chitinophagaceae bacterium]
MKFFRHYLYPLLLGLLIYTSIRVVTDTPGGEQFWLRPARQNFIEIAGVVIMSYAMDALLRAVLGRFNNKKAVFKLTAILFEFAILVIVALLIINPVIALIHFWTEDPVDSADFAIANIIVLLYVLLYYAIVRGNRLLKSYVDQKTDIERLQAEGLRTELKFLKAQYHPHFLFNALNTIYFQMDDDVPGAKKTIERFSDLLRYQLYDQQLPVRVSQELNHLRNYIALQAERSSEKLRLDLSLDNQLIEEKLYPLLLLPIVENAFKYIGGEYHLKIVVCKDDDRIKLMVENSVSPQIVVNNTGGIGLDNLRRRLELLYPKNHELKTVINGTLFKAELILGPIHE